MEKMDKVLKRMNEMRNSSNLSDDEVVYRCSKCEDKGYLLMYCEQGKEYRYYNCQCRKQEIRKNLFKKSGMYPEMEGYLFENFEVRNEQEENMLFKAKEFINNIDNARGMAVVGSVGSGKTRLVASVANELMRLNHKVLYISTPEFFDDLKMYKHMDSEGAVKAEKMVENLKEVEVLILDDVGKENISNIVKDTYYRVFNYRSMRELPTVFSSEKDFKELGKAMELDSTSIISRLYYMTKDYIIKVNDKDKRV